MLIKLIKHDVGDVIRNVDYGGGDTCTVVLVRNNQAAKTFQEKNATNRTFYMGKKNVNCKISRLEQITRRILEKVKLMHQEENV